MVTNMSVPTAKALPTLHALEKQLNNIVVGKKEQIRLALVCLLARGHLLLEDLPGSGKTTLAKSMAALLGLDTSRIQFTADMLPSDITGAMIYQPATQRFVLQRGAVFTNILLADEINRASPKCQSALLEVMEEQQVTIEGKTLAIKKPFFVIATQNPVEQFGTYPLPESQLDRFLFRLSLGYMNQQAEVAVLSGVDRSQMLSKLKPMLDTDSILQLQQASTQVTVSPAIARYVCDLLHATRSSEVFLHGLSTRAGMATVRAGQAYALMHGDSVVYPEHIQAVFPPIAMHRLTPKGHLAGQSVADTRETLVHELMNAVAIRR